jgi:hypothetical protein
MLFHANSGRFKKKNCEEKTSNPDGLEILMTYGA